MNFQRFSWNFLFPITFLISTASSSAQTSQKPGDWQSLKPQYDKSMAKKHFGQALPIRNGCVDAKLYGDLTNEMLNLNEVSLWPGIPRSYNDPNSANVLVRVRQASATGAYKKADSLSRLIEGKIIKSISCNGNRKIN